MSNQADYQFILEEILSGLQDRAEKIHPTSVYDEGRLMAYYEILSAAINQAEVIGLQPSDIGLNNFDPDVLLTHKKADETSSDVISAILDYLRLFGSPLDSFYESVKYPTNNIGGSIYG